MVTSSANMSGERNITSSSKRTPQKQRHKSPTLTAADLDTLVDPSPLSSCPPASTLGSPPSSPLAARKNSSINNRLQNAPDVNEEEEEDSGNATAQNNDETSFLTSSFPRSSQRIMKKGNVVVTNLDSDTGSDSTIESPDELLAKFMPPPKAESSSPSHNRAVPLRGGNPLSSSRTGRSRITTELPKYNFSIDDLLVHSVDDNEMRANVTKARQTLERPQSVEGRPGRTKRDQVLESAVEDRSDPGAIQRLRDAVDRTEVFDRNKSWSFFEDTTTCPPSLRFPQQSIPPQFWGGVLRDPDARERAFFSGIVGESWSTGGLPDELILWLLHAVTVEPRDDLRYAYCSSLKLIPAHRLEGLINPSHISKMFRRLGAKSSALAVNEAVQAGYSDIGSNENRDYRHLLSVLDVVTGLSTKLNHNTRKHLLKLLLRLTLDEARMDNSSICVATQDAIISLLQESDDPMTDFELYEISMDIFKTVQDVTLQSHLLKHLLPITPRASLFRSRLALAFLYQDPSPLDTGPEHLLDLEHITAQLDGPRFDVSRKSELSGKLDYWSFSSLISILSAAIDCGTTATTHASPSSSQKAAEDNFNRDVDHLAERVKAMFSSIHDSGASHLKRTEAKESLQVLHYRLIYAVRTRERPKKSWFVSSKGMEDWRGVERSKDTMERWVVSGKEAASAGARQEETGARSSPEKE